MVLNTLNLRSSGQELVQVPTPECRVVTSSEPADFGPGKYALNPPAQQARRLTALEVRSLKEPGRYPVGDSLYLQVSQSGQRCWFLRYQLNGGKRREMGLGSLSLVSLVEAHEKALEHRKNIIGLARLV
jgi:hypothetical protein